MLAINDHYLVETGKINMGSAGIQKTYACRACQESDHYQSHATLESWQVGVPCTVDGMPGYQWYQAVFEME